MPDSREFQLKLTYSHHDIKPLYNHIISLKSNSMKMKLVSKRGLTLFA